MPQDETVSEQEVEAAAKALLGTRWTGTLTEVARAALTAAAQVRERAGGWRDISTAPTCAPDLMVWVFGGRYFEPQLVLADGEYWRAMKGSLRLLPTHWYPHHVPAAPAMVAEKPTEPDSGPDVLGIQKGEE